MRVNIASVFKDPGVAKTLSTLHDKYIVLLTDKSRNKIVFVCKTHYIQFLISKVDVEYKAYTATTISKENIVVKS